MKGMSNEILRRKQEWLERMEKEGKLKDPTEDHKIGLIALQNKIRRDIIKFIGVDGKRTREEIKEWFHLSDAQVKMHLGLLEQALFVEVLEEDGKEYYVLTRLSDNSPVLKILSQSIIFN